VRCVWDLCCVCEFCMRGLSVVCLICVVCVYGSFCVCVCLWCVCDVCGSV